MNFYTFHFRMKFWTLAKFYVAINHDIIPSIHEKNITNTKQDTLHWMHPRLSLRSCAKAVKMGGLILNKERIVGLPWPCLNSFHIVEFYIMMSKQLCLIT